MAPQLTNELMCEENSNEEWKDGIPNTFLRSARKFSEDWYLRLNPEDYPCLIAAFREYEPERKKTNTKNTKKIAKRSRKQAMSYEERRKKKNEAVRRHRAGIANTIASCEQELADLKEHGLQLDDSLKEVRKAIQIVQKMVDLVEERIEKDRMRQEPRKTVRRCIHG